MSNLLIETDQHVRTITINRHDKLNALNNAVLDELRAAFEDAAADPDVKGIILTGAGEKAFVAGADIRELSSLDGDTGRAASERGQAIFAGIEDFPKPVIAVVNGYALGGGTELALACHVRIGTASAVFGLPEVSLGLIPGYGGTQRLTRLVGKGRAFELIMTGRQVKAEEALSIGLVNRVAETQGDAIHEATEMLRKVFRNSPVAVGAAIRAINACEVHRESGYSAEAEEFGGLCLTDDFREGVGAFLEKRKPSFKGN